MKGKAVNLRPTVCNICGSKVSFVSNGVIYGREYGSGKAYLCENCEAYVGTHKDSPLDAMGILANKRMRLLKQECHRIFDTLWENGRERTQMYRWLAKEMDIPFETCHFGWFDEPDLKRALVILKKRIS